jgi:predicted ATPase
MDVKLKQTRDLNIITGGNDAGKSNVLRAISLFFENRPSPNEVFDFLEDVNHFREGEARDAKGRLTIWIKVHFNNVLGWQSLPEKFSIKKTWNRYSQFPDLSWSGDVSQSNITKFLNKIELHYVPAVKHPDIYSHYMRTLYEAIANNTDTDLKTPATALSNTINETAAQLREDIEKSFGVKSKIEIPTDFGALIERLRFSTEIHGRSVPLDKRGDGIQARHIPQVISYISSTNRNLCIWIYEEPENSLELNNSFKLAQQFEEDFSIDNQVFISTHSPAFYGLSGKNVSKFIASRIDEGDNKNVTIVSKFEDEKSPDDQLGIKRLIESRSRSLYDEIKNLNIINKKLLNANLPVVIMEGDTDVDIFREAANRYYKNNPPVQFVSCDARPKEGGGHANLSRYIEMIPSEDGSIRIAIFDNDQVGKGSFERLKGFD